MPLSPMMQQYMQTKEQYPDCILMYRLGDFYEMFFDDAKTASKELELVLTGKDCGLPERAPMCGVPYHALDSYLAKLVKKGYRVAICEQMEDPKAAKGIVKRDVVRVVSAGTVTESECLKDGENNYIASFYSEPSGYGVAFADISTGEIHATELLGDGADDRLVSEFGVFSPRETVCSAPDGDALKRTGRLGAMLFTYVDGALYAKDAVTAEMNRQFGEGWAQKFGTDISSLAVLAVGALLASLRETQKTDLTYIQKISFYDSAAYMRVDGFSRRSLEITETMRAGEKKGSLLWVLDKTVTSAGKRMLKSRLEKPLLSTRAINERLDAVQELFDDTITREDIRDSLRSTVDLERLATRIYYGSANARDLKALQQTLSKLPEVIDALSCLKSQACRRILANIDRLEDVEASIDNTICDEPPLTVREGGMIKKGCSRAVDELRDMMTDGKSWISRIESTERERTGIRSLKVGYNKVFGYYIEVSNSFLSQVPDTYIRRQTLVGGERFVTEELKDMESRVIGAKERDAALEYEIFSKLRDYVLEAIQRIRSTASAIAELDVYCSLAAVAREYGYTRPEVDEADVIMLKDSRHPVVERMSSDSYFVPNDVSLDCAANRLMLITGPNMAGKSTYMRQVALCCVMAQMGSFVPAASARIGLVDRVFTRVGASDDLASGNSTFMLEMNEVAEILQNATKQSLIIYDEIGRGTSTYDGMSIARAVVEYTAKKIGARTLFATHYHELTVLENELDGVVNYNIAAKKRGDDIVFLRKIIRGAADDSYGIEVARLAGVPQTVVTRAKQILSSLDGGKQIQMQGKRHSDADSDNISFADIVSDEIRQKLSETDLNTLTPYEALSLLYQLKKML